jgi:hypothetical protein
MPMHLQAHFYFLHRTIQPQKKNKKELASQRTKQANMYRHNTNEIKHDPLTANHGSQPVSGHLEK